MRLAAILHIARPGGALLIAALVAIPAPVNAVSASDVNCDGCISSKEIKKNSVRGKHVRKKAVTTGKLKKEAVTTSRIKDYEIRAAHLSGKAAAAIAARNTVHNIVRVDNEPGASRANGSTLVETVNNISDAGPDNYYLVQIGPGTWDLGNSTLIMKPHVDFAGAGQNVTRIKGSVADGGIIQGAEYAEIRHLTVENSASFVADNANPSAILNENLSRVARIRQVTAMASGHRGVGIQNSNSQDVRLQQVTVIASHPQGVRGIVNDNSTVTIEQALVDVTGQFTVGIQNNNSRVIVDGGQVIASGLSAKGFLSFETELTMTNLKIDVDGATPHCMENRASVVRVNNVQGTALSPGARCVTNNLRGTTYIDNSRISGVVFSLVTDDDGSQTYVSNSQLIGAPWFLSNDKCINTVNENFESLNSDCNPF